MGGNMNIHLNVNDLVEQLVELTKHQNEAISQAEKLSKELQEVKNKLMDKELEELQAKISYERDLDELAKKYDSNESTNYLSKVSNG